MPVLLLLNARFPALQIAQELEGELGRQPIASFLETAAALLQRTIYSCAPIDEATLQAYASKKASPVHDLGTLAEAVAALKLSRLEQELQPFVREDRSPEYVLEKKCDPAVWIAECAFFRSYYEKIFPPLPLNPTGSPSKNEFRFAAQLPGWTIVRKVNLDAAERREVLATLVATYESVSKKRAEYGSEHFQDDCNKLASFLTRFPGRRSLARLAHMLSALSKENGLASVSPTFPSYFLERVFAESGFPPYGSIALVNGVYPELKIPKPRGRLKKE